MDVLKTVGWSRPANIGPFTRALPAVIVLLLAFVTYISLDQISPLFLGPFSHPNVISAFDVFPELFLLPEVENVPPNLTYTVDKDANHGTLLVRVTRGLEPFLGLSLFVSMEGPRNESAGCWLEPIVSGDETGVYVCQESAHLAPGSWKILIWNLRRHRGEVPNCVPKGESAEVMPLIEYLVATNSTNCSSFRPHRDCFSFPRKIDLETVWTKPATATANAALAEATSQTLADCTGPDGPGQWIPISWVASNPRWVPDSYISYHPENLAPPTHHHVFAPFNCRYRCFTRNESYAIIKKHRILWVGDSRTIQLIGTSKVWLPGQRFELIGLHDRFGLQSLVHDTDGRMEQIRKALRQGRKIVMSSLLHDLGDFVWWVSVANIRTLEGPESCGNCSGNVAVKDCGACGLKRDPAGGFLRSVERLRQHLAGFINTKSQVFWISFGVCVPSAKRTIQHTDYNILEVLQDRAAEILSPVVTHIDLRHMAKSMQTGWCNDTSHFARNWNSLVTHLQLQIVLGRLEQVTPDTA